jgi:hypothetical protein
MIRNLQQQYDDGKNGGPSNLIMTNHNSFQNSQNLQPVMFKTNSVENFFQHPRITHRMSSQVIRDANIGM